MYAYSKYCHFFINLKPSVIETTTIRKMGIFLCILSALFHTLSNIVMKKLVNVGPSTIVASKFLVILMVVLPVVRYR